MTVRAYSHKIQINLSGLDGLPQISFAASVRVMKDRYDDVDIKNTAIVLYATRSRYLKHEEVFSNKYLVSTLQDCLLFVTAATGRSPIVSSATIESKKGVAEVFLPAEMSSWMKTCWDCRVPIKTLEKIFFSEGESQKEARTAVSYLCASACFPRQEDRFRYLWSGFNALYRHLHTYVATNKDKRRESAMLDTASRFIRASSMAGTMELLSDVEARVRIIDGINWYPFIDSTFRKDGGAGGLSETRAGILKEADRLILFKVCQLAFSPRANREYMKEEANAAFKEAKVADARAEAAFFACRYLYSLRNVKFHGGMKYELYPMKASIEREYLNELLNRIVLDLLDEFANGINVQMVKSCKVMSNLELSELHASDLGNELGMLFGEIEIVRGAGR